MQRFVSIGRPLALLLALLLAPAVALAQPQSRTHDTGLVQFDVFDNGSLGSYSDAAGSPVGTGFVFNGENGLFEGEVLVGRSSSQVSGDAYEYPNVEWAMTTPFASITPPAGFDEAYGTAFNDAVAANPIGVRVTERSYSNTGDAFVVVDLDVTNTTASALTGIHVGIFADWDVIGDDYADDLGGYDAGTKLLYVFDSNGAPSTQYFGVAALGGATVSGVSYDALPGNPALWTALTVIQSPPAAAADRRTVLGTGPYNIGAGQTVNVKFAFVGGTSLSNIVANAAAAQASVGVGCPLNFAATLNTTTANQGDQLTFLVSVQNTTPSPVEASLKLVATGPANQSVNFGTATVPGNTTVINRPFRIRVPANAPNGTYNLSLELDADGEPCASEQFTLTVVAPRVGETGSAVFEAPEGTFASAPAVSGAVGVAPNPFVGQTAIAFEVAEAAPVRLAVYDVLGREVAVLVDGHVEAGAHSATFDARGLAAGTYVYRLVIGADVQTGRMTLAH